MKSAGQLECQICMGSSSYHGKLRQLACLRCCVSIPMRFNSASSPFAVMDQTVHKQTQNSEYTRSIYSHINFTGTKLHFQCKHHSRTDYTSFQSQLPYYFHSIAFRWSFCQQPLSFFLRKSGRVSLNCEA